jgi:hypothetical protein
MVFSIDFDYSGTKVVGGCRITLIIRSCLLLVLSLFALTSPNVCQTSLSLFRMFSMYSFYRHGHSGKPAVNLWRYLLAYTFAATASHTYDSLRAQ